MWRRAISANSAAVNMPNGATNSFDGRVHGAVDARSVYTPAEPALISTVVASPVAIALATSRIAGMPMPDVRTPHRTVARLVDEVGAALADDAVDVARTEPGVGERAHAGRRT